MKTPLKQTGSTDVGVVIILAIWVLAVIGWVHNIIDVVHMVNDPITGMFILRCVGIIVAPVGAVLGWF